jgi:ABC-type branched-subunit amino acid transport system substrate-binding protein
MGGRSAALAVLVVIILVIAAAYAAFALGSPTIPPCSVTAGASVTSSSVKIGYLTELSGPGVSNGYAARLGAELAVNQTNAAGGVDGRNITLVPVDDQTDTTAALEGACTLAQNDGVLAITGPTDQGVALAVEGFAEAKQVPFVVSTVSSAILSPPTSNWTVTVEPDAVQWGAAVAKYVSEAVPGAKIALMTQNAEQQREMRAGVKWFASTYRNESVVFDQLYANAQFPWATAAAAAKLSGANAVVVSWISTAGFSESNVIVALESAGFQPSQIFVAAATNQVPDLGIDGAGVSGVTLFDGAISQGYPNATAFAVEIPPFLNATLYPKTYCGICQTEIGPIYYYSYLGMELIVNSIRNVLSSGQALTRADFMSSMKQASIDDAFGNTLTIGQGGSSEGTFYVVGVGPLNSTQSTYPLHLIKTVRFAPGTVPSYQLAKTA